MGKRVLQISLLIATLIISGTGLAAEDSRLNHAQNLLDNGRLTEAELTYKNILLNRHKHSINST